MRCPKCQYIGLDEGERCRHCGYDFSLSEPDPTFDLPIRGDRDAGGPLADLSLGRAGAPERDREPVRRPRPTPQAVRRAAAAGLDLPLFEDDAPLVTPPAVPRVPLSVRRTAPHTPRVPLEPHLLDDPSLEDTGAPGPPDLHADTCATPLDEVPADVAPRGRRVLAAVIDLAIVSGIDVGVIYFTLRVCDLTFADVSALPIVPLAAFLALLNGGYATLFTAAGGQTIGKMTAGIRVVPADAGAGDGVARVSVGTALTRAAACVISLIPAGLGFIVGLVRDDGRALHDALAHTRVVRA